MTLATVKPKIARLAVGTKKLTPKQKEVAKLVLQGFSSTQIAKQLYVSPRTVDSHLIEAYRILGVKNRFEMVRFLCETPLHLEDAFNLSNHEFQKLNEAYSESTQEKAFNLFNHKIQELDEAYSKGIAVLEISKVLKSNNARIAALKEKLHPLIKELAQMEQASKELQRTLQRLQS